MIAVDRKMLFGRLNRHCVRSFEGAAGLAVSRGHQTVTVEHVLLKLLDEPGCDIHDILRHYGIDASRVVKLLNHHIDKLRGGHSGRPTLDETLVDWVQEGWLLASVEMNGASVRSGALFMERAMRRRARRTSRFLPARTTCQAGWAPTSAGASPAP